MKLFLLAASVVYIALAVWSQLDTREWAPPNPWLIWPLVFGVPVCVTWITAEAVHALRPRRLLHARVSAPYARLLAGFVTGALGGALVALSLVYLGDTLPDWLTMCSGAAVSTLLVLAPWPRVRPGRCVHCGYDFSANTVRSGGLCAECGAPAWA